MGREFEIEKPLSPWVLRLSSWALAAASTAAYFGPRAWHVIPPGSVLDGTFLWLAVGLYVLPFMRTLKIGKLLELERDVSRTKEETAVVREQLSALANTVSAVATSVNTNVVHVNVTQSEERHPERLGVLAGPGSSLRIAPASRESPESRPAMAKKILNTLWRWQVRKYDDVSTRFLFKVETSDFTGEALAYRNAVDRLTSEGLIFRNAEGWLGLTDVGLAYCRDNYQGFGRDAYFNEESEPPISPERLALVAATIPTAERC